MGGCDISTVQALRRTQAPERGGKLEGFFVVTRKGSTDREVQYGQQQTPSPVRNPHEGIFLNENSNPDDHVSFIFSTPLAGRGHYPHGDSLN